MLLTLYRESFVNMLVLFHVVKQLLPYFVSFASIDEGLGITYAGKQDVPFYVVQP